MDSNGCDSGQHSEHSADRTSQPASSSPSLCSTASESSQDSFDKVINDGEIAGTLSPPTPDMEKLTDGERRRGNSLLDDGLHGDAKAQGRTPQRRKSQDLAYAEEEHKHLSPSSGGSSVSDLSSRSTSEDSKLDSLGSEDGLTDDEETGLTATDKRKRKRRRRRNTLLDQRVAGDVKVTEVERSLADTSVLRRSLINVLLIGLWYLFSISISMYNTWMFSSNHLNFHFPLFTTCMHMLVQFSLASAVLYFFPRFRPRSDSISNPHGYSQVHAQQDSSQPEKPLMTAMFYITRIGPCGAATGLDIGLGNMSLKFITLTFFTMCKSSSLAFVLLFAFAFYLETPSVKLILIIFTMTIGVIMMVAGETDFNYLGFVLIISSAFFSGFRWALTQILLLRNPATSNPFSTIFFLAPIMFLTLAILAIPVEGFGPLKEGFAALAHEKGAFSGIALLLFPGVLAFCMTSSEFALLQRTSVVTLSICGIFKEVVTISAAGLVFHDPLTPINVSGLLVTMASIAAYNYIKITKMRDDARKAVKAEVGGGDALEPKLEGDEDEDEGEDEGEDDARRGRSSTSRLYDGAVTPSLSPVSSVGREEHGSEASVRTSPVKSKEDHE